MLVLDPKQPLAHGTMADSQHALYGPVADRPQAYHVRCSRNHQCRQSSKAEGLGDPSSFSWNRHRSASLLPVGITGHVREGLKGRQEFGLGATAKKAR